MAFGNKTLDRISELANQVMAIANAAQFNPSGNQDAKARLQGKFQEITELIKALPDNPTSAKEINTAVEARRITPPSSSVPRA
jgi:hypothetical protein